VKHIPVYIDHCAEQYGILTTVLALRIRLNTSRTGSSQQAVNSVTDLLPTTTDMASATSAIPCNTRPQLAMLLVCSPAGLVAPREAVNQSMDFLNAFYGVSAK
jgi:hypothetical protein